MTDVKTISYPEQQLLDTLNRVKRNPSGFLAIYMNLSKLKPQNKQPKQLKIIVRMFDQLIHTSQSRLFAFSNSDMVVLGKGISFALADETIYKVRDMLQADPLVYDSPETDFSEIYNVESDFNVLFGKVNKAYNAALENKQNASTQTKSRNIEPEDLDSVLKNLETLNVAEVIRRQSAIAIKAKNDASVVFQEYFTSIADLKKIVAPDINILGDRWIFQHLTEALDRRMLSVLTQVKLFSKPPTLNLNLNISTIFTREFATFKRFAALNNQKITVEVQLMDIFQNINNYNQAKELLRQDGHKILIDSLSAISLQFIDINLLDPDYVKLIWSPGIADKNQKFSPKDLIDQIPPEKIVLARCDSEDGIKWGLEAGIKVFQGYFLDAMTGAMGKTSCQYGARCTLAQCIARRSVLTGRPRKECPNQAQLDVMPDIKSI
ncbi:MAG: hypothetical protein AB7U85_09395 [Alphaproteobacteria bacterium]